MTDVRAIEPVGAAADLTIGIVAAGWNRSITDRLLDGAVDRLRQLEVGEVKVIRVPGSLELALAARRLAESGCDAVVALGVIVKGDTDHYSIVVNESARGLTLTALETGVPVTNGILAVHDVAHALERAQPGPANKGAEAATAAVESALTLAALATAPPK